MRREKEILVRQMGKGAASARRVAALWRAEIEEAAGGAQKKAACAAVLERLYEDLGKKIPPEEADN